MISKDQVKNLSKQFQISEAVVAREYMQLLFLKEFYAESWAGRIYFKGGTAIRLVYDGNRFSEDLDFSVGLSKLEFEKRAISLFKKLEKIYPVLFKKKEALAGTTYLMTADLPDITGKIFIRLDFSLRNDVVEPMTETIRNRHYPILISSPIPVLGKDELLAEKIRAFLTRDKFRDFYDLWVLMELGAEINTELINRKMAYYKEVFDKERFLTRLSQIKEEKFIQDLRPFVPIGQRDKLSETFSYIQKYLKKAFVGMLQ